MADITVGIRLVVASADVAGSVGLYSIREHPDGLLRWEYLGDEDDLIGDRRPVLTLKLDLWNRPVTPEQAMVITGVDHPIAALDRLRDMIYEDVQL